MDILAVVFGRLLLSVAAGFYADRLRRTSLGRTFGSLLLSPLVALLFPLGAADVEEDDERVPCLYCAEDIKPGRRCAPTVAAI